MRFCVFLCEGRSPNGHFERFLPLRKINNAEQYKKVLLLSPDVLTNITLEKTDAEYKYYKEVFNLLKELGMEIIGIKSRHAFQFKNIGLTDEKLVINGNAIPLLSGYSSFPDAIKDAITSLDLFLLSLSKPDKETIGTAFLIVI